MQKSLKKIVFILVLAVILPSGIFIFYQFLSLDQNERIIRDIYSKQLDAILYSINQYSEDVASSWATDIEIIFNKNNSIKASVEELNKFSADFSSIESLQLFDLSDNPLLLYNPHKEKMEASDFSKSSLKKDQLLNYFKNGYRKIEPVQLQNEIMHLVFYVNFGENNYLAALQISPQKFVNEIMGPKIKEMTQDQFAISISKITDGTNIYESDDDSEISNSFQTKSLWMIPIYQLGIDLKGKSIDELIQERTLTNLILILGVSFVLLSGIYFVMVNLKKEFQLAQMKSDFISNVSHELRTPLALISMFSETLEMGRVKSDSKKQEYYSIISREANRLGRIVNTILNFSKMDAGKRKFNFTEMDLNIITDSVTKDYNHHMVKNGFELKKSFFSAELIFMGDFEAVSEAIVNLLDNAVKYSKDEKIIEILTGVDKDSVFLEIKDHGIGISDEHQKKVFDRFYRVSTGLVHDTKGTGLGLTLVYQIMEAHKGRVDLKSKLGKGSTFKLLFPKS
ncbi:MAG: HAMP domain-containing histidine kinase [Melioribacteraceae bacterium]|nr:HAMP domain-containing histidine kinase [Melioribacteraceae bacterium]MCF8264078.1 HAMP domain-containing histidine kinase [Melioribacteraceae bacterium]MCF8413300.1 HAMP domain-containing histidine kinase [Melioribacteraceae bacterium]MCF8430847.1 HAMP domain-containing histidine kinase [Melioribacteraceae bacterium]